TEPFNKRLVRRRGLHYWADDEDFDLGHHFVNTSLPKPGRIRELLSMISRVHSGHLDRDYPLWRVYLIEGLEDGRIALYLKIHHSLVDGVSAVHNLTERMATDPVESLSRPPPWEVLRPKSDALPLPVPTPAAGVVPAMQSLARERLSSAVMPLLRELRATFRDFRNGNPNLAVAGQAPRTIFNTRISATRRIAAQSYSMPRIKAVGAAFQASSNDVILAMCAGALRVYLKGIGELPERSLVGAVPVSVRTKGSDDANQVAFTLTSLATDVEDPAERLRAIRDGMAYNKQRMRELSPGQLQAYAALMLLPGAATVMLGLTPKNALATLCISHVPGPRVPMYWQGAKLSGLYPLSLATDGGALNITIVSRHDFVDFGLVACRKSVPHMQRLLDHLEDALKELESAI
ncbi:MAG: wax ester/triacylglycerol synthase family O-acyltransferase, partial [Panacagrimonas sp.]